MTISVVRIISPEDYSLCHVTRCGRYQRFGEACCLHLQDRRIFWVEARFGEKLVGLFMKERDTKSLNILIFKYYLFIYLFIYLFYPSFLSAPSNS